MKLKKSNTELCYDPAVPSGKRNESRDLKRCLHTHVRGECCSQQPTGGSSGGMDDTRGPVPIYSDLKRKESQAE